MERTKGERRRGMLCWCVAVAVETAGCSSDVRSRRSLKLPRVDGLVAKRPTDSEAVKHNPSDIRITFVINKWCLEEMSSKESIARREVT